MAHHKSAKKRIRQTETRTEVNRARVSRVRTFLKKVEVALDSGNSVEAAAALRIAEPELMRAAQVGVFPKNMAARKVSRLTARLKTLQQ